MGDIIKKPDHYCEGRKYEPKDVIRDWGLNFNLGSAVKYISRAGRKGDKLEDLKKAKQFLEFEIEELEKEEESESEIEMERKTCIYVNGLRSQFIDFNSIPDEYKHIVIDKIAQEVLDKQCDITLDIPTDELRKLVINRIVERINNGELDCFDISGDLYHGYQEIRDALIIQVLRNAGDNTFISKTYAHHAIKGRMTFDSIPDEYKSGVIDRIVEMIDNDELTRMDIPTDLYMECGKIREAIARRAFRKVGEEQKSDIGMTCKEAAEIGDAIAKGFKEGFKESEEKHDESDLDIYCRDFDAGYDMAHADLRSVEDTFTFSFKVEED